MKKIISVITFLSLILSAAPAFAQSGFDMSTMYQQKTVVPDVITPILKPTSITFGAVSPEVATYQQYLKDLGFYKGAIDGKFGIGMKTAVAGFQASYKLNADAILGQGTKDKIAMQIALAKANGSNSAQSLASAPTSVPSSNPFLNCSSMNTTPQIKVVSPNGGETFTAGGSMTVKWASCNIPKTESVLIEIIRENVINVPIGQPWIVLTASTPNDGSQTFSLGQTIPSGTYALAVKGNLADDMSNNLFTINSGAPQQVSTVILNNSSVQQTVSSSGSTQYVTYNLNLAVTNNSSDDYFIPVTSGWSSFPGFEFGVFNGSGTEVSMQQGGNMTSSVNSFAPLVGNNTYYKIEEGTTQYFSLTIIYRGPSSGQYRVKFKNIRGFIGNYPNNPNTTPQILITPMPDIYTSFVTFTQ